MRAQVERGVQAIKKRVQPWLDGKDRAFKGWLAYGAPGCGKTSASLFIAYQVARTGRYCRFITAPDAIALVKSTWGQKLQPGQEDPIKRIQDPDLLILDDPGTKEYSGEEKDMLYRFIIGRENLGRVTALTTNLDLSTEDGISDFCRILDGRYLDRFRANLINANKWGGSLRRRKA